MPTIKKQTSLYQLICFDLQSANSHAKLIVNITLENRAKIFHAILLMRVDEPVEGGFVQPVELLDDVEIALYGNAAA